MLKQYYQKQRTLFFLASAILMIVIYACSDYDIVHCEFTGSTGKWYKVRSNSVENCRWKMYEMAMNDGEVIRSALPAQGCLSYRSIKKCRKDSEFFDSKQSQSVTRLKNEPYLCMVKDKTKKAGVRVYTCA